MLRTNQHEAEELGRAMRNLAEVSVCEEMMVDHVFSTWRKTLSAVEEFRSLSWEVHEKIEEHILQCVYADVEEVYPVLPLRIQIFSPVKRVFVTEVVQGRRVDCYPVYCDASKFTSANTPEPAENGTSCTVSPVDIIERCASEIGAVGLKHDECLAVKELSSKRRKV
jgi:hypothetical protein